jgi:hypothetical protein
MPHKFRTGCPLPDNLREQVLHTTLANLLPRHRRGTCNKCIISGELTEVYRNKPCPHTKWLEWQRKYNAEH